MADSSQALASLIRRAIQDAGTASAQDARARLAVAGTVSELRALAQRLDGLADQDRSDANRLQRLLTRPPGSVRGQINQTLSEVTARIRALEGRLQQLADGSFLGPLQVEYAAELSRWRLLGKDITNELTVLGSGAQRGPV